LFHRGLRVSEGIRCHQVVGFFPDLGLLDVDSEGGLALLADLDDRFVDGVKIPEQPEEEKWSTM